MPTSISGMRRSRRAAGIAALACGALLVVPAAQARNVQVDVSLENSNGYGMSIGASRSSGSAASFVVYGAERELTAEASAPLQDLAKKAAADVPGSAKLDALPIGIARDPSRSRSPAVTPSPATASPARSP